MVLAFGLEGMHSNISMQARYHLNSMKFVLFLLFSFVCLCIVCIIYTHAWWWFRKTGGNIYITFKKFWISNAHSNEKKIQNQTEIKPTQWQSPNSYIIKYILCVYYMSKLGGKVFKYIYICTNICVFIVYMCALKKIWTFKAVFRISKIF